MNQAPPRPPEATGSALPPHATGSNHADLNAHNLLFDAAGKGWLIDFDKGELRIPATAWRERNLRRLRRSLLKDRGSRTQAQVLQDFARLRESREKKLAARN